MLHFIKQIKLALDRILEGIVIIAMSLLVFDVLWQVFARKVLENPSKWTEEAATFLLVWVALLGAAVALGRGAHLGIDYFTGKLALAKRIKIETAAFTLIFLFSAYVMVYGGWDFVSTTLELGQVSASLGIKMGYIYLAVPVSGVFMCIYSFMGIAERLSGRADIPVSDQDNDGEVSK
ncbi:Neu5Ac permease [Limihaloglobus sulfuriphilus]|uniref:Neu5Ac permease n=2 Tax=Limihaloglobus sulfuriphilus TaxID=1851148 RepID=A0A1Q2MCM4_9BACT|nr:Neu5Ac permease [Limihaloglobus sulfuriphilus]